MADIKRTMLVYIPAVAEAAQILTGYGGIAAIDHEGTITFELEGEDEFELGRTSIEIQQALETLSCGRGSEVISARSAAARAKATAKA